MKYIWAFILLVLLLSYSCKKEEPATKACFSVTPANPTDIDDITFDASCSVNAKEYYWFIDHVPTANITPSFTKRLSFGNHDVMLLIKGPLKTDSILKVVSVSPAGPTPCFTITNPQSSDFTYNVNTEITFDSECSTNADYFTSTWDFGDGSNGSYQTVKHTYTTKGTFTVNLLIAGYSRIFTNNITKQITIK